MNSIGESLGKLGLVLIAIVYLFLLIQFFILVVDFYLFGGQLMPKIQKWFIRKIGLD